MLLLELPVLFEETFGRHGEELGGLGGPVTVEDALSTATARDIPITPDRAATECAMP